MYRGSDDEARAIFARSRVMHLATTDLRGDPVLRTVHGVLVVDGRETTIAFHGAPVGEKMEGIGRKAVLSAEEIVASIPSFFVDPERACPATTYYLSAQAHGTLELVGDPDDKAEIVSALMSKYQPEGGYAAVDAHDPMYAKQIAALLVARVRVDRVTAKAKLGQNRRPEERARILEQLWARGRPDDVSAIATILARCPDVPTPAFLHAPAGSGLRLSCASDADFDEAVALLHRGAYWLEGVAPARTRAALERSTAAVCARDDRGALVAFARAVSDGRVAWIYDVVVAEHARRTGAGTAVMRLLLDHPAVRNAERIRLTTRDAVTFYRRLGFRDLAEAPFRPYPIVEMILSRSEGQAERSAGVAGPDGRQDAQLA